MKNTPSQDNIKHINVYIFSGFEKKKRTECYCHYMQKTKWYKNQKAIVEISFCIVLLIYCLGGRQKAR